MLLSVLFRVPSHLSGGRGTEGAPREPQVDDPTSDGSPGGQQDSSGAGDAGEAYQGDVNRGQEIRQGPDRCGRETRISRTVRVCKAGSRQHDELGPSMPGGLRGCGAGSLVGRAGQGSLSGAEAGGDRASC